MFVTRSTEDCYNIRATRHDPEGAMYGTNDGNREKPGGAGHYPAGSIPGFRIPSLEQDDQDRGIALEMQRRYNLEEDDEW